MVQLLSENKFTTLLFKIILLGLLSFSSVTYSGQLSIQLENDSIFAIDGNYTNGFSLGWESKALLNHQRHVSTQMPLLSQWQHAMSLPISQTHSAWGLKLSQRMWTPNKIDLNGQQSNDRPYAGLLELESHTADYGPNFTQKNWFALGVIGPESKAAKIQVKVHELTGSPTPRGWHNQVQTQITMQLAYEIDALLFRTKKYPNKLFSNNQWELSSYSHLALGNFNTDASLGLLVRWGTMLNRTFGRLSSHYAHLGNITQDLGPSTFCLYSRVQLGYRFSDLSIEGQLPYDSRVNITHKQAKAALGLSWTVNNYAITWSLNSYSREFITDKKSWHSYGSLTLSYGL